MVKLKKPIKKGKHYQVGFHTWAYIIDITENFVIFLYIDTHYFEHLLITYEPISKINQGDTLLRNPIEEHDGTEASRTIMTIFEFPWKKIEINAY